MHVLLSVAAVGEAPVTALELTLERFLPCGQQTGRLLTDTQDPKVLTKPARLQSKGQEGRAYERDWIPLAKKQLADSIIYFVIYFPSQISN